MVVLWTEQLKKKIRRNIYKKLKKRFVFVLLLLSDEFLYI